MAGEKPKKKKADPVLGFSAKLLGVCAAMWILFSFVIGVRIYHGERMYPALRDGDLVFFSRLSELRAGDLAVYASPEGSTELSRVAGTQGFDIDISELGELHTNGYVPLENNWFRTDRLEGSSVVFPLKVGAGEYFLLDDCRPSGRDSRIFGTIPEKDIRGKVVYVLRRRGF